MIEEKYLDIIDKHLGEKLFVLYIMDSEVKTRFGKLTETYSDKFTIHDIMSDKEVKINYFQDSDNYTVGLYNYYGVNLIKAKTPMNMQAKMSLSAVSSALLPKLKQVQDQKVNVINFEMGKYWKTDGLLTDLGVRDLIISSKRNTELNDKIAYSKIIHIFDNSCIDIIAT